jgi:hypothetical protein
MCLHPLEEAFWAQSWKQRVDLIQGNHMKEMESILISQTSSLDPLNDDECSYAVVAAFWDEGHTRYPEGVDVKHHINHHMWKHLTDRLSEWKSNSLFHN